MKTYVHPKLSNLSQHKTTEDKNLLIEKKRHESHNCTSNESTSEVIYIFFSQRLTLIERFDTVEGKKQQKKPNNNNKTTLNFQNEMINI